MDREGSWWMSERSSGGGKGAGKGLQTEYEFTLPRGYVDTSGDLHRKGVMRLATAIDEIAPLRDPRVRANQAYLTVVLLARVVTQLGTLSDVSTGVIEGLFSADVAFLQDFYQRINEPGGLKATVTCPSCDHTFDVDVTPTGGS
jgi:hypothetical protein